MKAFDIRSDAIGFATGVSQLGLTQAETAVLQLMCLGMTNKEVAVQLATTVSMVKWHASQIFEKLHVQNRVQAMSRVRQIVSPISLPIRLAPAGPMPATLKNGERRILELLSFGLTYRQIAQSLGITHGTVKWYMRGLFGKLQVRNRIEALARARQVRWL